MRPKRYRVEYDDPERFEVEVTHHGGDAAFADPAYYRRDHDADTLEGARDFARTCVAPVIYERINVRDETPPEDPPGFLWEWDERFVDDGP